MSLQCQIKFDQLGLVSLVVCFCREIWTMLHTLYSHSQALSQPATHPPTNPPHLNPPVTSMADSPYSHWKSCMRVDGLFLMNEGPKWKCIPVPALRRSSWLFGEFMSDVCVLHPCSTQENKIKHRIESKGKRRTKKNMNKKNINNKEWGPGGWCAENCWWKCCCITWGCVSCEVQAGTKEELKLMTRWRVRTQS